VQTGVDPNVRPLTAATQMNRRLVRAESVAQIRVFLNDFRHPIFIFSAT
jgi:hypothetical protein